MWVATFPAAVGMASPHLPGPEPLYLFLPQRLGAQRLYSLGALGLQTASQPGVAVPRCGAKIQGKAAGLRVCVSLPVLSVPGLSCLWLACVWSP